MKSSGAIVGIHPSPNVNKRIEKMIFSILDAYDMSD